MLNISHSSLVLGSSNRSLYSEYSLVQQLGLTTTDPGVHLGICYDSFLAFGLNFYRDKSYFVCSILTDSIETHGIEHIYISNK